MKTFCLHCAICSGILFSAVLPAISTGRGEVPASVQVPEAKVFQARARIPRFRDKLAAGKPVTALFLGGSITSNSAGFTGLTPKWLQERYPKAKVNAVNAGISGTPSRFGAQRIDRDVLSKKPDLVFVEFAVNDGDNNASEDMERIVRKVWTALPETEIVFLYTLNANSHLPYYAKGIFPLATASHERVAEHYGIPAIAIGLAAANKLADGTLKPAEFAADGIHPTPQGYAVYQAAIEGGLGAMLQDATPATPRQVPPALTPGFALYKPAPKVEPMPGVPPMDLGDGRTSLEAWSVPVVGKNWIRDPVFCRDEQALWRLRVLPWDAKKPTPDTGRYSGEWRDEVEWFPEADYFCGTKGGTRLLGADEKGRPVLTAGSPEVPVLEFIAPVDGTYFFRFAAAGVDYFGPPDRTAMVNVFHLPWGAKQCTPLTSTTWVKQQGGPINLQGSVVMRAGESLAFVLAKDSGSRPSLRDLDLKIGRAP
jgi:lysophospholipase L1-like esterase